MAEIWQAHLKGAAGFEREVCIKLVQPQYSGDPEFRRMFENEALITGRLQHQNIVQVFDYDHVGDMYYIAMEYVSGRDLRTALNRAAEKGVRPSPALAARICMESARGLGVAHAFRLPDGTPSPVIHRDISPHNILLSFSGEVKLADFGIAKLRAAATHTQEGTLKGKVNYMSPEQAWGRDMDPSSDVFSMGIILWEMLAGKRLFGGDSELKVLEQVRHAPIPDPSEGVDGVPAALAAITVRALARDCNGRFADAGAMADAIQHFLYSWPHDPAGESVSAFMHTLYPDRNSEPPRAVTEVMPGYAEGDARDGQAGMKPPMERTLTLETGRSRKWLAVLLIPALAAAAITYVAFTQNRGPAGIKAAPVAAAEQVVAPATKIAAEKAPENTPEKAAVAEAGSCTVNQAGDCATPPQPVKPPEPPAAAPQPPAIKAVSQARTGTLSINAAPWAHVYFRGRDLGTTPLTRVALPAGVQTITLKNPEMGVEKTIRVKITAGAEAKESVDLTEE
jgi:hypothetical protein